MSVNKLYRSTIFAPGTYSFENIIFKDMFSEILIFDVCMAFSRVLSSLSVYLPHANDIVSVLSIFFHLLYIDSFWQRKLIL